MKATIGKINEFVWIVKHPISEAHTKRFTSFIDAKEWCDYLNNDDEVQK